MEDRDIIALYWARSEDALSASAEKYGGLCRIVARNILHSGGDEEECLNDTWLNAWNSIPPQRPENLSAYLARLTRNLALNQVRLERAQKRGEGEVPAALAELEECAGAGGGVEDRLNARELTRAIENFLRDQPRKRRNIFIRRYWYLSPVEELAREYGMTRSGVSSLLHRMRGALKQHLEQEGFL